MKQLIGIVLAVLACSSQAFAQDELVLSKLHIGTALCTLRAGSSTPEGAVTGKVCDIYIRTDTGEIYRKLSGTGNTGWVGPSALTKTDDTNVTLTLGGTPATSLLQPVSFTIGWTGTLAAARLNANVVQSVVNDTNVTGSIAAQALTIGWTGTLAYGRGGCGNWSQSTNGVLYAGASACATTAQGPANSVLTANAGAPSFSATPIVTSLTATGALQGATVTGTTSVTTPIVTSGANVTLSPTGDLITDPAGNDILPVTNYDIRIGAANLQYLSLDVAELHAQTLVAQDVIATIGGLVEVAPTTQLVVDAAAADTTIHVKHNEMASGDRALLKTAPAGVAQFEVMAITSSASSHAGHYDYTVTRNLDGTGANQWYAGDAVLNTGTTGDGFIDLYSTAGVFGTGSGPAIVGNVRTGTSYNAIAPRWAIGNLNGLYGYGATTYGAAFGDASATNVTVDATNGFRVRHGTTNKLTADTSGNLSLVGNLTVSAPGVLSAGNLTINSSGITMAANTGGTYSAANAYSWNVANGEMWVAGSDVAGSVRGLETRAYRTGTYVTGETAYTQISIGAIMGGTFNGNPTTRTASITMTAAIDPALFSGSTLTLSATNIVATSAISGTSILLSSSPAIVLTANNAFIEGRTSGGLQRAIIGINSSNVVSIDSAGLGVSMGAGLSAAGLLTVSVPVANHVAAFNSNNADGGYVSFLRSSSTMGYIGMSRAIMGSGYSASDFMVYAGNNLDLRAANGVIRLSGPDAAANRFKFISGLTAVLTGSELAGLDFESSDGSASGSGVVAQIYTVAATDFTGGTRSTNLIFSTANGTSVDERMRLSSTGVLTVSGFGSHGISSGSNGEQGFRVTNTASGSANYALLGAVAGTASTYLYTLSQGYSTSAYDVASAGVLVNTTSGGLSIVASHAGGEIRFYPGGTSERQRMDANGDWRPTTDNTMRVGLATHRYTLIRGVTITSGDLQFENGFTFTEHDKVGIAEPGIALLDPDGEVVAFFGRQSMRGKGRSGDADIDALPYVKTTAAERAQMDAHPELRVAGYLEDGTPLYRTAAERPMPDPKGGKTNRERRQEPTLPAIRKAGGQQ